MRQLGRSLTWTKNRSGPRLLPCGTPQETGAVFDKWPFVLHFWFRSQRYDSNHLRLLESMPYFRSFRIRIVWSMVSKAFFPGGGGVLPNMGYIGMCGPKG